MLARLSIAIAAAATFGLVASAQVPRGFTPQGADQQRLENDTSLSAKRYQSGVEALQARNFVIAEGIFDEFLLSNPTHPDANFMMGVTKMSMEKWEEAKKYLEVAVKKNSKAPDPKSRLGVTLAKLGDVNGAMEQRAALEKMGKDCKGKCRNAQWIANGITMIDEALPARKP